MRTSKCYVDTLIPRNYDDEVKLRGIKDAVSVINATNTKKKRVVLRGRKPFKRIDNKAYDWGGNIVGGIRNASVVDVYIYDRR